ncbi:MAG: energy transducer TonB [Gammaproteobacteria bacterium]|nr:energy transducer TonB [Gammaproteobacteria bacterium]
MRFAAAFLIALIINLLLFFLMQIMLAQQNARNLKVTDLIRIDYVREQSINELKTPPRRTLPPKPEPPQQPKPAQRLNVTPTQVQQVAPLPAPKLASLSSQTGGPFLGNIGGGAHWIDAGELVALVRMPPEYPAQARMRRIEGFVDVEFIVDQDGRVRDVTVLNASPPGIFDRAAIGSVRYWKFAPKQDNGHPIQVVARQRIEFKLNN